MKIMLLNTFVFIKMEKKMVKESNIIIMEKSNLLEFLRMMNMMEKELFIMLMIGIILAILKKVKKKEKEKCIMILEN